MSVPSGYWQDLTSEDFAGLDPERVVALLPVAAIEQHGPHLPLYTDTCICEGVVIRALELLPDEAALLVLPTLAVGDSTEHLGFPGTLSATPETLIRFWREVGDSVARAGVRKLVIFNSHGGQPQIVDIVALELRRRHAMLVVAASAYRFGVPAELFDDEELTHGVHGGAVETSMMLHLRPDLVRQEAAENFEPMSLGMSGEYKHLSPTGRIRFAWCAEDLHPDGVAGDATAADAEAGRRVVEHWARNLVELVEETARFPLDLLRDTEDE